VRDRVLQRLISCSVHSDARVHCTSRDSMSLDCVACEARRHRLHLHVRTNTDEQVLINSNICKVRFHRSTIRSPNGCHTGAELGGNSVANCLEAGMQRPSAFRRYVTWHGYQCLTSVCYDVGKRSTELITSFNSINREPAMSPSSRSTR
jgi:hypothetical protein